MSVLEKPKVEDLEEMLEYLDELRESASINMFGAGTELRDEYPRLSRMEARAVVRYWMETFGQESR